MSESTKAKEYAEIIKMRKEVEKMRSRYFIALILFIPAGIALLLRYCSFEPFTRITDFQSWILPAIPLTVVLFQYILGYFQDKEFAERKILDECFCHEFFYVAVFKSRSLVFGMILLEIIMVCFGSHIGDHKEMIQITLFVVCFGGVVTCLHVRNLSQILIDRLISRQSSLGLFRKNNAPYNDMIG